MLKTPGFRTSSLLSAVVGATLAVAAVSSQAAITKFEQDVATSIDKGITYLANQNYFAGGAGDATGIVTLALLEKRASGLPTDPPQGYTGANAVDQGRLRSAASYILNQTRANGSSFAAYRDGSRLFALAEYALTGGPDKSVLAPGNAGYDTIKEAMDRLVDRALANQVTANNYAKGYWCYHGPNCADGSTTQFASAGLASARAFYSSVKTADQVFADPARVTLIDAALTLAKAAYDTNAGTGSDNGNCGVLSATERGHGYHPQVEGYNPSLQQTASGIYIQLFGGSNVNTPSVQHYMEWLRNHYRYSDLDNMGNSWPSYSWSYYLWSSFKGMEIMRLSATAPAAGNLTPNSLGTLPAASAPACTVRQENKDPAVVARPALFGAGGVGYYAGEQKNQYFDYAHQILTVQCGNGSYDCLPSGVGYWDEPSHNGYLLLVLLRSSGKPTVATCDADGNGAIDSRDINIISSSIGQTPGANDPRDANVDGRITINDVRMCTQKCAKAKCAI